MSKLNPVSIIEFVDYANVISSVLVKRYSSKNTDSLICDKVDLFRNRVVNGEILKIHSYKFFSFSGQRHYFMARLSKTQIKRIKVFMQDIRSWDELMDFFDEILKDEMDGQNA